MDTPVVEMTFTLEKADFSRALQLYELRSSGKRLKELGISGLIVLPVLLYWLLTGQPQRWVTYVLAAAVLLPMLAYYVISRMAARQGRRQAGDAVIGVPITWRFGQDALEAFSGETRARSDWSQWIGFIEANDYFFLFASPRVFNILPKRGLGSPEEASRLRELLRSKLPPQR